MWIVKELSPWGLSPLHLYVCLKYCLLNNSSTLVETSGELSSSFVTVEDVEMGIAGECIYRGLAGRGGKESPVFSPLNKVIWGPQKVELRVVLISWKQNFFFEYWSCFCLLPVCTKPHINVPQPSESFSWLLWSTSGINKYLGTPVCSHSCSPTEDAGAVQSWTRYQKEKLFLECMGSQKGKCFGGGKC